MKLIEDTENTRPRRIRGAKDYRMWSRVEFLSLLDALADCPRELRVEKEVDGAGVVLSAVPWPAGATE